MVDQCNIVGNLLDSGITAIGASLEVTANSIIIDDTTTPDSIILPAPRTFTIPNTGVININLPPTEPSKTTYTFKLNAPGYFQEWIVSIPDQASVSFASLLKTSFTQDKAVTGALRVSKEMVTNPLVLPYIVAGLNINRSATPPSAGTGLNPVWINMATGIFYTWDTVNSKWQSEVQWRSVGSPGITATGSFSTPIINLPSSTQVKISHVIVRWSVGAAPHDGSNYWNIQPRYKVASSVTPVNVGTPIASTVNSYAVGTVGEVVLTPETIVNTNSIEFLQMGVTKVSSPSDLQASVTYGLRYLVNPA